MSGLAPNVRSLRCIACRAPAANWHHVLSQSALRRFVKSQTRDKRHRTQWETKLIADSRNKVPMCFDCHMAHENWSKRLGRWQVPESAWEFAAGLGDWATATLERGYPVRTRRDDSPRDADARTAAALGARPGAAADRS